MIKGQIAFSRRSYPVAEKHFDKVHQGRPNDAEASKMLALSLIDSTDPQKQQRALELAQINQRSNPQNAALMATLGWVYFRLGKIKEAEAAFQRVAATGSVPPNSAYFLAQYLASRQRPDVARELLEAAIASRQFFMYRARAEELLAQLNSELEKAKGNQGDGKNVDEAGDSESKKADNEPKSDDSDGGEKNPTPQDS